MLVQRLSCNTSMEKYNIFYLFAENYAQIATIQNVKVLFPAFVVVKSMLLI